MSGLLDVLLNKGVYLDLDAIVTVAEVPLIGISLRAVLGGMETMLEYGMMDDWDERTRAWARRSLPSGLDLGEHEEIVTRMPGSAFRDEPPNGVWQPGTVFLTTQRLLVHRSEPSAVLWQAPIDVIAHIGIVRERTVGGEEAQRLVVMMDDGATSRLTAARPDRLRELFERTRASQSNAPAGSTADPSDPKAPSVLNEGARSEPTRDEPAPAGDQPDTIVGEGELWFAETRSAGAVWRRGIGRCDRSAGFTWRGDGDRRPAVRVPPSDVLAVRAGEAPEGADAPEGLEALALDTRLGVVRLAAAQPDRWSHWLEQLIPEEVGREHAQDR
ncbi:gas vesicle protein [Sinomonas terrae]|uniref:Gas vesicle protein n=1 Tax=Sinomonas terrae TaxID=2908838 RepID=A0ABS9U5R3_9MICC|nr:gas vesicle protein [Sinomonas terrae]MCH6472010.1 gas vesicle protein [Sinomonas terrae]